MRVCVFDRCSRPSPLIMREGSDKQGSLMTAPYLSLAVLTRDTEGAATLERALRSAIERPDGPMFDEIVIVFGGAPFSECAKIVSMLQAENPNLPISTHNLPADIPLTAEGGLADFAKARNFLYSKCRGA